MEINSNQICKCIHREIVHSVKSEYSKSSSRLVTVNSCNAKRCKCKNFQTTSFQPETKKFKEEEPVVNQINSEQTEMLPKEIYGKFNPVTNI